MKFFTFFCLTLAPTIYFEFSLAFQTPLMTNHVYLLYRGSFVWFSCLAQNIFNLSLPTIARFRQSLYCNMCMQRQRYSVLTSFLEVPYVSSSFDSSLVRRSNIFDCQSVLRNCPPARCMSSTSIELKTKNDVVRFSFGKPLDKTGSSTKGKKMAKRAEVSKKAKLNELRFYRLKAKKKMNSPNPEVRIRYKLEKVGPLCYLCII